MKFDQEQMDELEDLIIGNAIRSALLSGSDPCFAQLSADLHLIFNAYTAKLNGFLEDQDADGKWLISCAIRDKMALRIKLEIKRIEFIMHSARLQQNDIDLEIKSFMLHVPNIEQEIRELEERERNGFNNA